MPFNGSGGFSVVYSWVAQAAAGVKIVAANQDVQWADVATNGLSNVICKDGQTTTTALIPFAVGISTAAGVQFPAIQATSADVNNLDDYEEGTFTPGLTFGGGSTGINYVVQSGTYTKIGNRVFFSIYIIISNKGSSTGNSVITNLPFTSANGSLAFNPMTVFVDGMSSVTVPLASVPVNSATINPYQLTAGSVVRLADTNFTNTSTIAISGHYAV